MMWSLHNRGRATWLGLATILIMAYIGQIIPHNHPYPGHAEPRPEPNRHEHHAHHKNHSHHADGESQDSQDPHESAHHHHDLSGHLDTHFLRSFTHDSNPGPDVSLQAVQVHGVRDREPDRADWLELDLWMPASIPIFPLDSRGPPAIG